MRIVLIKLATLEKTANGEVSDSRYSGESAKKMLARFEKAHADTPFIAEIQRTLRVKAGAEGLLGEGFQPLLVIWSGISKLLRRITYKTVKQAWLGRLQL